MKGQTIQESIPAVLNKESRNKYIIAQHLIQKKKKVKSIKYIYIMNIIILLNFYI